MVGRSPPAQHCNPSKDECWGWSAWWTPRGPSCGVDRLIRRTGRDPSGPVGPVGMEQIYKVTRLTCCVRPLQVVHMADCHFLCVSGWRAHSHMDTYTAAATAFQTGRIRQAQVCCCSVVHKVEDLNTGYCMALKTKKAPYGLTLLPASCQLVCTVIMQMMNLTRLSTSK